MKIIRINDTMLQEKEAQVITSPLAIAAGMFDGMHIGHQSLLGATKKLAQEHGLASGVLSITSKPKNMQKNNGKNLMTEEDKIAFLKEQAFDYMFIIEFSDIVRHMKPEAFLEAITTLMPIKYFIAGADYRFGHMGAGTVEMLTDYGQKFKYQTKIMRDVESETKRVSSTIIKDYITAGQLEEANKLLSYPYQITAEVVHGEKKGRVLGFPTINMIGDNEYVLPPAGVYATKVLLEGKSYIGLTNIGYSPTVKENSPLLVETNILGFSGDLYGEFIQLQFHKKIRDELKFSSIEALIEQMEEDKVEIIKYFEKN